jgi:hypothetical protein
LIKKEGGEYMKRLLICSLTIIAAVTLCSCGNVTVEQDNGTYIDENIESASAPIEQPEITVDQLQINNYIPPVDYGTVWMNSTFTNNSSYPIVYLRIEGFTEDTNESVVLEWRTTVLPGEISPNFLTFGPLSQRSEDIKSTTYYITYYNNNKTYRLSYDVNQDLYFGYSGIDVLGTQNISNISIDQFPFSFNIYPEEYGTISMTGKFTNNSAYSILSMTVEGVLTDTNESFSLNWFDTVAPGETSPGYKTDGPESQDKGDIKILTYEISYLDGYGTNYLNYDTNLNLYDVNRYY